MSNVRQLRNIHDRIEKLRTEEPEDDFVYAPTQTAMARVDNLLSVVFTFSNVHIRRPLISPDGDGGLVFEWRNHPKDVKLFIPATSDRRSYLYYENDDIYDVIRPVNPVEVSEWIQWSYK